jgi:PAS domain S-box-containing protein
MTPERWQQIEKLYHEALKLEPSHRAAFLKDACAGDEALRQEVESLLRSEPSGDRFIEQPALEVAAKMMAHEKPESLLGQQLGSYQILSLLGTGGMGVVYKARDTRLKRSVAIKVLPADQVSDPDRKRRFIQEARAASALNHPNIITIHDVGSESGIDFVVMEYVAGKTLDQRIPRKGMRLDETLKLAIQMAEALAKAHSAGIIHRDLKPGNLMVTEAGLVKVLDFGLARRELAEDDITHSHMPVAEGPTIAGTLAYMSPEVLRGRRPDSRSDVWALGVLLYEMVSGRLPFVGQTSFELGAAILEKSPAPLPANVPATLGRLIERCLMKTSGERPLRAREVQVALESFNAPGQPGASRELEQLFSLSLDMICIAGMDGYFRRVNPAWSATLGWSAEELLGGKFLDLVHPDDRAATIAEGMRIMAGECVVTYRNRYRCRDGSYRCLEWSASAVDQNLTYAVARDVTQHSPEENHSSV